MTHRKQGIGFFGLLAVVALGVMAFASSAQALTPQYIFKNKAGVRVAVLDATATATQEGEGTS